jgi:hypothetical protein
VRHGHLDPVRPTQQRSRLSAASSRCERPESHPSARRETLNLAASTQSPIASGLGTSHSSRRSHCNKLLEHQGDHRGNRTRNWR